MTAQVKPNMETGLRRSKRRGFTLTEIAIVLGIVGLILGAIWIAAQAVYTNLRVSQMDRDIVQIVNGTRNLYSNSSTITPLNGDITTNLANANVVSADLITNPGGNPIVLNNVFGGTMFVSSTTDGLGFVVTVNGMPASGCVGLIASVAGTSRDPSLQATSKTAAAALAVASGLAISTALTFAVPPVTDSAPGAFHAAGTGCTANINTNAVQFVYALRG